MKKFLSSTIHFLVAACVGAALVACSSAPESQPLSALEIPFSGESIVGTILGEEYRYFRYDTVEEALVDKAKVSADGKEIDGKRIGWDGPIHIYHLAKRIVLYVGDNTEVMATIEQVFGPQVAGE